VHMEVAPVLISSMEPSNNVPIEKDEDDSDKEEGDEGKGSGNKKDGSSKSRRELPAGAVATLKQWLLSPEHFTHPYPTPQDQVLLMQKTGIDKKQLKNWFTNARRRIWKPMLKKQLEQGTLAPTNSGGGGVAMPGIVPGLVASSNSEQNNPPPAPAAGQLLDSAHALHAMQAHYQQALQQQQQQQQQVPTSGGGEINQNINYYAQQVPSNPSATGTPGVPMTTSYSIGSLPPMNIAQSALQNPVGQMNKTDSHAVLMELFARDQDLVRQATENAKRKAAVIGSDMGQHSGQSEGGSQHPMKMAQAAGVQVRGNVPTLNSWPHFSSVASLNNLGNLAGVKSIASLSGADLASQGNLGPKGNLAQIKSQESMGRADSYAFLEVFFDDRNNSNVSSMWANRMSGNKREREEDNDVGLSLDADESPSNNSNKQNEPSFTAPAPQTGPKPAPLPADGNEAFVAAPTPSTTGNNSLKRAYDDALAARGLLSVSRSSERLSEMDIPAKMQRTLSQELLRQHQFPSQFGSFGYAGFGGPQMQQNAPGTQQPLQQIQSSQFPSQFTAQLSMQQQQKVGAGQQKFPNTVPLSDPSMTSDSVEVPASTVCSLCHCINVDTQLRPCGHMFHGRCLKPSLQNAMGPPCCPIDGIPMQSAVLAVPTEELKHSTPSQPQSQNLQQTNQQPWINAQPESYRGNSSSAKPETTKSSGAV